MSAGIPKKQCQIQGCARSVATLCYCCQKNVCSKHFNDHIEAIKAQLHPLVDQINEVVEKIQNLKIEQLANKAYEDLDQWRADIHKLIDDIYSIKRKEIEQIVETNEASFVKHKSEQMDEIEKIKLDVEQLISEDDATVDQIEVLKSALQTTETNLATVQKQFIAVNIRVLDPDLVRIKCDLNTNMINLNTNQEQQQESKLRRTFYVGKQLDFNYYE
ncbi:unnamed protein product [Didymodactylos carnosus]|uniref:Uncharacterized protein n=1 Tax=Didymodactylos carnosus TaxID=1234261 RepID=A0A815AUR4_9BILA|nr:unnamed protein product [Didymodactylos carnosus]CAF1262209.1 unnamed protein product [Didymodactylos carnosus]CAF3849441.1 unnamed protein product [Didymodactylos carnosus]CAF4041277.1 unnamed protein product [Didymodactylos carnosus]